MWSVHMCARQLYAKVQVCPCSLGQSALFVVHATPTTLGHPCAFVTAPTSMCAWTFCVLPHGTIVQYLCKLGFCMHAIGQCTDVHHAAACEGSTLAPDLQGKVSFIKPCFDDLRPWDCFCMQLPVAHV
jgi:hypothetical protein